LAISYLDAKRIRALSTDTLPTNVPSGTIAELTDVYFYTWFDGTDWLPVYESVPLSGSHGYIFGGHAGTSGGDHSGITELQLGVDATSEHKALQGTSTSRGSSAQTKTLILTMGGNNGAGNSLSNMRNQIQEYTIGSDVDSSTKAILWYKISQQMTRCYSNTHAYMMGGNKEYDPSDVTNYIQEYEIGTTTTATQHNSRMTSEGSLLNSSGGTDGTYCYTLGGQIGSSLTLNIDMFEMGTNTRADDKGNISEATSTIYAVQNTVLLIGMGGNNGNSSNDYHVSKVDEYTMASTGNATDKGDLLETAQSGGSVAQDGTYGYAVGGYDDYLVQQYQFGTTTQTNNDGDLHTNVGNCCAGGSGTP